MPLVSKNIIPFGGGRVFYGKHAHGRGSATRVNSRKGPSISMMQERAPEPVWRCNVAITTSQFPCYSQSNDISQNRPERVGVNRLQRMVVSNIDVMINVNGSDGRTCQKLDARQMLVFIESIVALGGWNWPKRFPVAASLKSAKYLMIRIISNNPFNIHLNMKHATMRGEGISGRLVKMLNITRSHGVDGQYIFLPWKRGSMSNSKDHRKTYQFKLTSKQPHLPKF